jgi:hypothetical protein
MFVAAKRACASSASMRPAAVVGRAPGADAAHRRRRLAEGRGRRLQPLYFRPQRVYGPLIRIRRFGGLGDLSLQRPGGRVRRRGVLPRLFHLGLHGPHLVFRRVQFTS